MVGWVLLLISLIFVFIILLYSRFFRLVGVCFFIVMLVFIVFFGVVRWLDMVVLEIVDIVGFFKLDKFMINIVCLFIFVMD